jgi:hypothetical protein
MSSHGTPFHVIVLALFLLSLSVLSLSLSLSAVIVSRDTHQPLHLLPPARVCPTANTNHVACMAYRTHIAQDTRLGWHRKGITVPVPVYCIQYTVYLAIHMYILTGSPSVPVQPPTSFPSPRYLHEVMPYYTIHTYEVHTAHWNRHPQPLLCIGLLVISHLLLITPHHTSLLLITPHHSSSQQRTAESL